MTRLGTDLAEDRTESEDEKTKRREEGRPRFPEPPVTWVVEETAPYWYPPEPPEGGGGAGPLS